jgi:GT2 family glycosyltransferase
MPEYPSVYIIILTWNDKACVLECIESMLKQDYPNYKTIVVDNASVDGSQEAIRLQYPQVHLIANTENLGFAGGNNVGLDYALKEGADWTIIINNDTIVAPDMVSELMKAALEYGADMAGPMMYYYPPKGQGNEVIWYAGGVINYFKGKAAHIGIRELDKGQYQGVRETGYVTGCCILTSRRLLEKIGLMDTGFKPIYAEDADWSAKAAKAGFKLIFVPDALLWHKVTASSGGGLTPFKVYYKIRNNLKFFRRHAKFYHWLTIPLFVVLGGLSFVLRSALSGNFKDIFTFIKGIFVPKRVQAKKP